MKPLAHRSLSPKKIKKLAAQLDDQEILASLAASLDRCYIVEARGGATLVGFWSESGPMICMNDDSVLAYAQKDFLRRQGQPTFTSDEELMAHATKAGWLKPPRQS